MREVINSEIRIKNVSKKYRIYESPKDRVKDALGFSSNFKDFLALDNISLEIGSGEFWGIIGKNGSGKSTLLKIIARQLQPTSGEVFCNSRITLLQLGLGFDPELSGIENIKLSRLAQTLQHDQEDVVEFIREFSELGDFINYPIKTYSSGMYSRLAFATAVAGNPDVLIADEVLSVGDLNFSQKCLAKMREFKDMGKTVVLVTHDINAVKSFCNHAAWINNGKLISQGPSKSVSEDFRNYMLYGKSYDHQNNLIAEKKVGGIHNTSGDKWRIPNLDRRTINTGEVTIDKYRFFKTDSLESLDEIYAGSQIGLSIVFHVSNPIEIHSHGFTIHDQLGRIAVHLNSEFFGQSLNTGTPGRSYKATFKFDVPMLKAADYSISFGCLVEKEGRLVEKYDYDSVLTIKNIESESTDRQGGYVIVPLGEFEQGENV